MMNKRISLFTTMLIVVLTLTGCQLAVLDGDENKNNSKLIGAYVSFKHVDLFDIDGYLNHNLNLSDGEIKIDGNTKKYDGRMYATRKDEVKTDSQGKKYSDATFVFEKIDGIGMFSPTINDPLNEGLYISSNHDAGFCDVKSNITTGGNEDGLELEGTVYISSKTMSDAIYINPVYQSSDGSVYLTSGQGFSVSRDNSDGSVCSQTLTDTVTVTENNKRKSYSTTVKISAAVMSPIEKITIIQMDKNSNILKKAEYNPDAVPENLLPEKTLTISLWKATN
ncbi:MAG: hypothetical protein ACRDA4_03210 [Filifactoraceae bacterium]